ncbi:MAG: hypothetical protein ABIP85_27245 [Chthoniobacteraceae bacterium]
MKSSLALAIIALSLVFTAPGHARSNNASTVEGTVQTLDLKARHATLVTKKGKTISFHWNAIAEFTTAAPLRRGARVAVKYHEVLIGENYVTRIEVRSPNK